MRHGQSAQVQNQMIRFDKDNVPFYKFDGDDLLSGETDGSSYNNGGNASGLRSKLSKRDLRGLQSVCLGREGHIVGPR